MWRTTPEALLGFALGAAAWASVALAWVAVLVLLVSVLAAVLFAWSWESFFQTTVLDEPYEPQTTPEKPQYSH